MGSDGSDPCFCFVDLKGWIRHPSGCNGVVFQIRWVLCKFPLNGLLDPSPHRFGGSRNVLPNNAPQVFETILQSQALSCDTRFVFFANRSSAIREKYRSS